MDELDLASDRELRFREQALKEVRDALVETDPEFDGKHCLTCHSKMPKLRLDMGRIHCVHCQTALENRGKFFRK